MSELCTPWSRDGINGNDFFSWKEWMAVRVECSWFSKLTDGELINLYSLFCYTVGHQALKLSHDFMESPGADDETTVLEPLGGKS